MPHLSRTFPLWMFTTSLLLMALSSLSPLGRPASAEQDLNRISSAALLPNLDVLEMGGG